MCIDLFVKNQSKLFYKSTSSYILQILILEFLKILKKSEIQWEKKIKIELLGKENEK